MGYPDFLAAGVDQHAGQDPFHLFAGDAKVVTGPDKYGSDCAQFTVLGRNGAGELVPLASGFSAGTITVAGGNAVADDTVTVNGTAITWKAGGAAGNQVNIGATAALSATALAAFINANKATLGVEASAAGAIVTVTAIERGLPGDDITLAETGSSVTISGANLTGGDLDNLPEAKGVGIAAQPVDVSENDMGPTYKGGCFNHEALVWPAGINTLEERKAVFDGTPILIGRVI